MYCATTLLEGGIRLVWAAVVVVVGGCLLLGRLKWLGRRWLAFDFEKMGSSTPVADNPIKLVH